MGVKVPCVDPIFKLTRARGQDSLYWMLANSRRAKKHTLGIPSHLEDVVGRILRIAAIRLPNGQHATGLKLNPVNANFCGFPSDL